MATSSSLSSLTRLLSLATSLHEKGDLSLQQLVPVHASLCQALGDGDTREDTVVVTSLEDAVESLKKEDDREHARRIIEEGTQAEKLLLLQYLIGSMAVNALQALSTCVVPFLLQHDEASEDLREALLDAVFVNTSSESSSDWLNDCFESCQVTGARQWTVLCRVLVRLYNHVDRSLQECTTSFIYDKVMEGIQLSLVSDEYMRVLNPIVTWLLPLLFEGQQQVVITDRVEELWICLLTNLSDGAPKNQQVALVVSAILCSIIPSLLTTELPVISDDESAPTRTRPVQQESLWNLVMYSLQQGMDSTSLKGSGFQTSQVVSVDQMLRRRGLYLLRLLVESSPGNNTVWLKYVLCFEALEMETEQHLVDQVWDTVAEICAATSSPQQAATALPTMTWEWISCMLARVLLSDAPILRKLGLYRFLSGHAGIQVSIVDKSMSEESSDKPTPSNPGQKRHAIKSKKKKKGATPAPSAPISLVSEDFVLNILIPSYDALSQSMGTNMHFEENGRIQAQDVTPLLVSFLGVYVSALDMDRRHEFLRGLLSPRIVCDIRLKNTVMIYEAVASVDVDLPVDQELLQTAVASFGLLLTGMSIVGVYRERLMASFATMLSQSCATDAVDPEVLLKTLAFYPVSSTPRVMSDRPNLLGDDDKYDALEKWLAKLGNSPSWAASVGAACASSFVMGQLFPPMSEWTPESGSSEMERLMGGAIVLLCALAAPSKESNASELLWPAIHKGLATVPQGHPWHNASRTSRSLILLENGCRLGLTSGIGNGDLVIDKSQQMMPPPSNIELLLSNAVDFDLQHIETLTSFEGTSVVTSGNLRSGNTARVSSMLANLVSQMQVLCHGYPSSLAVSSAADKMLQLSIKKLASKDSSGIVVVQNTALAFGALSCGADPKGALSTMDSCRLVLNLAFPKDVDASIPKQTARSVFQYAKWGTLSHLLQSILEAEDSSPDSESERLSLLNELFDVAEESVYATPADAMLPLFDCVVTGARNWLSLQTDGNRDTTDLYTENLTKIIDALFALKSEVMTGRPAIYVLNEICALLFRPDLLMDEYERLVRYGNDAPTPIRDAFRRLMEMAGTKRPHISRIALSYISVAWLGTQSGDSSPSVSAGLGAIPYRTDICDLLLHKEMKLEESSSVQETDVMVGPADIPYGSDDTSVARGFILMFLSRVPDANDGLPPATLKELLHFIIFFLLDDVCLALIPGGAMLMLGSVEYSKKIRAWQALCVLSRFVTEDIADEICDKVFECMGQNLHGQIRYFLEAFTIQCARRHPSIFGRKLVEQIRRKDLTIQNVSTLMIVAGNLIVGRYKDEFFLQFDCGEKDIVNLKEILAGVIPWLSSTQGFSRAISQLLVHKLVPLVIELDATEEINLEDTDWFLRSIYRFLEENNEMKRLRKKQSKFFDTYDVDEISSAERLLQLEVDEGAEARPDHMVDAIKKCLEQVYLEAHENEGPEWKQVAEMMEKDTSQSAQDAPATDDELVNFQRKIIPLDSLELDLEASRDARLKNARGRKKQQLVVVASLVDKVPNLGGLARTSEIFAVERLLIPDTSVCRMDNFKSISVGAGDWIDIEGCKEDVSSPCLS